MEFTKRDWRRWEKKIKRQPDGCWLWVGSKNPGGYGQFKLKGKVYLAHRLIYELTYQDPGELQVRHLCPAGHRTDCVNPEHLALGDNNDNVQDKVRSGSAKGINQGERNGRAKLSDEQVLEIYHRVHNDEDGKDLAIEFGVSAGLVSQIKLGRVRKYLELPEAKIARRGSYERTKADRSDFPTPKEIARFMKRSRAAWGDCIVWIGTLGNGYGVFNFRGSTIGAHRFAYWVAHGELPAADIAHECGDRACVNPAHLRALTRAENMTNAHTRERLRKAGLGHRRRTKLADAQIQRVKEVYRDYPDLSDTEVVKKLALEVTPACVARIRKGETGDHVRVPGFEPSKRAGRAARGTRNRRSKLVPVQVYEIRRRGDTGEHATVLAEEFAVSRRAVDDIVARRTWRHLPEED